MLVHWIWLSRLPVNDRTKAALVEHFSDPEDVYYADARALEDFPPEVRTALGNKDLQEANEILEQCREKRVSILTFADAGYPGRLKNIPDPPVVLYYCGVLPDFDGMATIAVVGTRSCTAYGIGIAKRLGYQIAKCGGLLVSGVADGIDGASMRGALSAGKPVVGIVGGGVDVVYPKNNRDLYEDLRQKGCLISEYPPGTEPIGWHFPRRNRIISGVSCGVLVVEAPKKSGALITARSALEQGRDVFVVPGNIDVPSCEGSNDLLREGAIAVKSGWDVVSEYENIYPVAVFTGGNQQSGYIDEVQKVKVAQKPQRPKEKPKAKPEKKDIDNGENIPYIGLNEKIPFLSGTEKEIIEQLHGGQRLVDEVIAGCSGNAGAVLAALTLLEIKGMVLRLPGKMIMLKGQ